MGRPWSHRVLPVGLGLVVLGVGSVLGPTVVEEVAGSGGQRLELTSVPKDSPDLGLVYEGLQAATADSLCAGTYQLDAQTCSHGPDPAPSGLAVRRDVVPVAAKAAKPVPPKRESGTVPADEEIARDEGGSALTPEAPALVPDAPPGEATFILGTHNVACESDGRSGKRVQALYVHEAGTPSRFSDFLGSFRAWAAGVDQIFDDSAAETGGSRHIRFVTTPQCQVDVSEVQLPDRKLASFKESISALETLGYNRNDRKYLLFADANVYCGIATFIADRRAGAGNRNNGGPSYGRIDAGCWSAAVAARELTQSLGATLADSPNASGAGGCLDEYDLLCGTDRSGKPVRNVCPKKHENRLDCGHDDYFSTNPKAGSYLAKNWNVAQSEFLLRGDGGDDDESGLPPATEEPSEEPSAPASADPSASPSTPASPDPGSNGGADPVPGVTADPTADPTGDPATDPAVGRVGHRPGTVNQAAPVQAVLEIRDATSSSVRLSWSAASPKATYEVWVGNAPIATTKATRARLIGLKPDSSVAVSVKSGDGYLAKATAETAPAARPAQNTWFTLTNALTGAAADMYAARTADGTPLTLSDNDGSAEQQWQLIPAAAGGYSLVSRATNKCAVPLDGKAVVGAPLVQGDCSTAASWQLQASPFGFTLCSTVGELVVGAGEQRFGADRVLVLQNNNGQRHQSWTAVPD